MQTLRDHEDNIIKIDTKTINKNKKMVIYRQGQLRLWRVIWELIPGVSIIKKYFYICVRSD